MSHRLCLGPAERLCLRARVPHHSPHSIRTRAATTMARSDSMVNALAPSPSAYPSEQPRSHKRPEFRKSQIHRQYQSILRSSPCILFYQHNNLKVPEWTAVRRQINAALTAVDAANPGTDPIGAHSRMTVINGALFAAALRVVEFWTPPASAAKTSHGPADHEEANVTRHGLSRQAWRVARKHKGQHELEPLLSGPLMIVEFPAVSPDHIAAVVARLSPSRDLPAPKRKVEPGYHEPVVQNGVAKMMLLGARIDGQVFDFEGARRVAGIAGGLDGLRARLVGLLGAAGGAEIVRALEGHGRSLYATLEGRKMMMMEEEVTEHGKGETPSEDKTESKQVESV